jgi:hypothetical protein
MESLSSTSEPDTGSQSDDQQYQTAKNTLEPKETSRSRKSSEMKPMLFSKILKSNRLNSSSGKNSSNIVKTNNFSSEKKK